jgi:hypothetical protein
MAKKETAQLFQLLEVWYSRHIAAWNQYHKIAPVLILQALQLIRLPHSSSIFLVQQRVERFQQRNWW